MIVSILPNGITMIIADDGKSICRASESGPSTISEVYLAKTDSVENWKDCDYGEDDQPPQDEPTMEDANAALRRFGVEV